jgi:hypothetical protein
MPSSSPAVPVSVLREALRQRVAESSLRAAGIEVGMSWKGVDKFLAGSKPQSTTIRKLTEWYIRQPVDASEQPSPETIQAAAAILVRHVEPIRRAEAVSRVIAFAQTL